MGLAPSALDFQSTALHGGKMGAARNEGDIGARLGQCRAESTTDPAGADNRDTHGISPDLDVFRSTHSVQGAQLVAVGIAQIGEIEFARRALAQARRGLAGLSAMGDTGRGPRVSLCGRAW